MENASKHPLSEYPPGVMLVPMRSRTREPFHTTNLIVMVPKKGINKSENSEYIACGDALLMDPGCCTRSHSETIATVCMFLAGKVEETPRPLKDVILVSYEIIHKKDPAAIQRIKQREVYEQQKELILLGERMVLTTLGFDLNVHHPYKPLVEAIKKFKVAQNALAQVAWKFVNDGLRTSLCLQFKPHHIAAGAIFLAAKFLKVKLPSDGDKVWWQEFDVTPRQLEEVSNQMLELYEQNRAMAPSHGNETEGSSASVANHRGPPKTSSAIEDPLTQNGPPRVPHDERNNGIKKPRSSIRDSKVEGGLRDRETTANRSIEEPGETTSQTRDKSKGSKSYSPLDAIKKIVKDKVTAALEKRRKERSEAARKIDVMDDDDLIERELESGIELATEDEKVKQERRHNWSKLHRQETQNQENHGIDNDLYHGNDKETDHAEEGEFHSPELAGRKRKPPSPSFHHPQFSKHRDAEDSRAMVWIERDHKRLRHENRV